MQLTASLPPQAPNLPLHAIQTDPVVVRGAPQRNAQETTAVTRGQGSATRHVTLHPRLPDTCDSDSRLCLLKVTPHSNQLGLSKYIITFGSKCGSGTERDAESYFFCSNFCLGVENIWRQKRSLIKYYSVCRCHTRQKDDKDNVGSVGMI